MTKRTNPTVQVTIGRADNVFIARDGVHVDGDAVTVQLDEVTNSTIGGDLVSVSAARRPRSATRQRDTAPARPVRRALLRGVVGTISIASMVAASGIATALGWT